MPTREDWIILFEMILALGLTLACVLGISAAYLACHQWMPALCG